MTIQRVGGSAPWEQQFGYVRAVLAGDWAITAGTTATVDGRVVHPGDPYGQATVAFRIALDALAGLGVTADRVVRSRMYVTDLGHSAEFGRAHFDVFGQIKPVATMVEVTRLIDPAQLIEVELEAFRG